jgi:hypothetical protein
MAELPARPSAHQQHGSVPLVPMSVSAAVVPASGHDLTNSKALVPSEEGEHRTPSGGAE